MVLQGENPVRADKVPSLTRQKRVLCTRTWSLRVSQVSLYLDISFLNICSSGPSAAHLPSPQGSLHHKVYTHTFGFSCPNSPTCQPRPWVSGVNIYLPASPAHPPISTAPHPQNICGTPSIPPNNVLISLHRHSVGLDSPVLVPTTVISRHIHS